MENYKPAGFWKRFLAYMIDYFILSTVGTIIGFLSIIPIVFAAPTDAEFDFWWYAVVLPVSLIIGLGYYVLLERSRLQGTIGKYALQLQVVDQDGNRISGLRAFARAFCMIFSFIILGIGWLMIAWRKDKRALHDLMSGCYVIQKEEVKKETV